MRTSASATTNWATESATVIAEGSYKFIVVGTFDFSGGKWAGAQLFVDTNGIRKCCPSNYFRSNGSIHCTKG